jgi:microsomal dipeptidase-like Zn-dependent dipeptidase
MRPGQGGGAGSKIDMAREGYAHRWIADELSDRGSSTGVAKQGLTPFGTEVVRRLEKRSIVIDLAHEEEIAKISGGNVLRVLRATLPATHGR